jgi:hypothetical protein
VFWRGTWGLAVCSVHGGPGLPCQVHLAVLPMQMAMQWAARAGPGYHCVSPYPIPGLLCDLGKSLYLLQASSQFQVSDQLGGLGGPALGPWAQAGS